MKNRTSWGWRSAKLCPGRGTAARAAPRRKEQGGQPVPRRVRFATRASHRCPHAGQRQRTRSSPAGARSAALSPGRSNASTNWSAINGCSDARVRGRVDARKCRHRRSPRARASVRALTVGTRTATDGWKDRRAITTPHDHSQGSFSSSPSRTTCCSWGARSTERVPSPRGRIRTYRSPASLSSFRASRATALADWCHRDGSRSTSRSASAIQRSTRSSTARPMRRPSAPTVTVRSVAHWTSSATSNSSRLLRRPARQVGHCVACFTRWRAEVSHSWPRLQRQRIRSCDPLGVVVTSLSGRLIFETNSSISSTAA